MEKLLNAYRITTRASSVGLWWRRVFGMGALHAEHDWRDHLMPEVATASEDAILLIDKTANKFVSCNAATVRMLHAQNMDQVLYTHPWELSPEYQADGRLSEEKSAEMNALAEQNKFHRFEWLHKRLDGELFPVEVTLTTVRHGQQELLHVVWRDMTEMRRAEQSVKSYQRALTTLSAGNRTLVRSTDERQLIQDMCRVAVDKGGFRMAWVGYRVEDEAQSVRPLAYAGCEEGYLKRTPISWGENQYGNGPTGLAIRTGKTQLARDIQTAPHFAAWREDAVARGYTASIALPLKIDGKTFGALMLYADTVDPFDEAELALLEEMAEDLSYGVMALRNDIARRQAEAQLDKSYSLLQAAIESTADGILVTALSGEIESYNQRFANMFGIAPDIMARRLGIKVADFIAHLTSNPQEFMATVRAINAIPEGAYHDFFDLKDGRTIERISQPQYLNGMVVGRVCCFRDISEQKNHESQLTYLATHDALTDLPNRNLLNDRLEQAVAHADRTQSLIAVLFFDLDRFKLINDSLGHDNGDVFLKLLSQRLPGCIREGDTVARMGGDEFVVLLPDLAHEEDAATVAHKLLDVVAAPYNIAGRELFSMASIGIALYPRDGGDAATLLKHADAAMYRAKESGGNCFQFFTGEINSLVQRQLDVASKLRYALERNELQVFYQPQYDLKAERITGAEALLRWRHPELGMVSPVEFIPVAEETGLIHSIGAWVVETVCAQQRAWQTAGMPEITVAINLSARQFDLPDLVDTFVKLLDKAGVSASCLEIEITEGMVMKHPDRAIQILNELKAKGFAISIDDFGTGYSSLGYLKRFPINKLKIDRSFIMDITEDRDDAAITRAVIAMAHELRLKVVAEGVETGAQLDFLQQHGCDVVQGYLTGHPMQAHAFTEILASLKA